jgi:hypothetical protein
MTTNVRPTNPAPGGSALQRNGDVRRIYTTLQPSLDESWEVATVIETRLVLDAGEPLHDAAACERLVNDIEADAREGLVVGRVIVRGV